MWFCYSLIIRSRWSGRIPVRLYVRNVGEYTDDFEDVPPIDSWDRISYINKPVEIHREEGMLEFFFTKTLCVK